LEGKTAESAMGEMMEKLVWGTSQEMAKVRQQAMGAAKEDIEILLLGETGTGKGLIAGIIHAQSPRASNPFVHINIAGISKDLLASELFGHEKGAFTGP
jgi:transcriptional regulator with PAS, ATPase and Fis domain